MKKVRVILASAACMVAAAGVYAKVLAPITTYYLPLYADRNTTGAKCGVTITSPCDGSQSTRCTYVAGYIYEQSSETFKPVISKIVNSAPCTAVFKNP
jgi:hypothetical protein